MTDELLRDSDMVKLLRAACAAAGSQRAWADSHGFSTSYISDVLRGHRDFTEALANALGYVRKSAYFPMSQKKAA